MKIRFCSTILVVCALVLSSAFILYAEDESPCCDPSQGTIYKKKFVERGKYTCLAISCVRDELAEQTCGMNDENCNQGLIQTLDMGVPCPEGQCEGGSILCTAGSKAWCCPSFGYNHRTICGTRPEAGRCLVPPGVGQRIPRPGPKAIPTPVRIR